LANIKTLTGTGTNFQRDLAKDDWLSIPAASPALYHVTRVDPNEQKIDVETAPVEPIRSQLAYVDGPQLDVSDGAGNRLLQVDRRGAMSGIGSSWSGGLTVSGLAALNGGAQITGTATASQGLQIGNTAWLTWLDGNHGIQSGNNNAMRLQEFGGVWDFYSGI